MCGSFGQMYYSDSNAIVDKVLASIGQYENNRLRDDLYFARQESLFLKYLNSGRHYDYGYDRHYDYGCCRHHHHKYGGCGGRHNKYSKH